MRRLSAPREDQRGFALVMVLLCVSLAKDLRSDPLIRREEKSVEIVEQAVLTGNSQYDGDFCLQVTPTNGDGLLDGGILARQAKGATCQQVFDAFTEQTVGFDQNGILFVHLGIPRFSALVLHRRAFFRKKVRFPAVGGI